MPTGFSKNRFISFCSSICGFVSTGRHGVGISLEEIDGSFPFAEASAAHFFVNEFDGASTQGVGFGGVTRITLMMFGPSAVSSASQIASFSLPVSALDRFARTIRRICASSSKSFA